MKTYLVLNQTPRHEDVWASGGIVPSILNIGARWKWEVSSTPRPFYPWGKIPRQPLDRRFGGSQSRPGRDVEEKNSQPLLGIETRSSSPQPGRYTDWEAPYRSQNHLDDRLKSLELRERRNVQKLNQRCWDGPNISTGWRTSESIHAVHVLYIWERTKLVPKISYQTLH